MATAVRGRRAKTATATTKPTTKSTAKTAPAKEPVKKKRPAAAAKAETPAKTKTAAKASTAKKAAPKKVTEPKASVNRDFDLHGFVVGSDSSIIAETFVEGGESRATILEEVAAKIEKSSGLNTRGGNPKNLPSLASNIMKRLIDEKGYTIEQSFRLVPPPEVEAALKKQRAAEKRAAARKAKK